MEKIHVEVIQPQKTVISDDYDHIIAPGVEGDFGVYFGHLPFITKLRSGVLELFTGEESLIYAIHDGYVSVENGNVTIVCETIEAGNSIDLTRAENSKKRAEQRMKGTEENVDFRRAELALKRALIRLNIGQ